MRVFFLAFTFLSTSFGINASGSVDFLEVDNDVVLFSTTETKITTSPTCVATDNANLWTVSLVSDSECSKITISDTCDDGRVNK